MACVFAQVVTGLMQSSSLTSIDNAMNIRSFHKHYRHSKVEQRVLRGRGTLCHMLLGLRNCIAKFMPKRFQLATKMISILPQRANPQAVASRIPKKMTSFYPVLSWRRPRTPKIASQNLQSQMLHCSGIKRIPNHEQNETYSARQSS